MWANTCWGFLSLAVAFALARLSMIWTVGHDEWGPRLIYAAIICGVLSGICFFWPFFKRIQSSSIKSTLRIEPELCIVIGHDGHYVETKNTDNDNVWRTVLIGVKNTGGTYLSNCELNCKAIDRETSALQEWIREGSFSLNVGEEKYIRLASYNEPLPHHSTGRNWIKLHAQPSGNFWRPPTLSADGGNVTLTATSAESRPCEVVCRLWVKDGKLCWDKA